MPWISEDEAKTKICPYIQYCVNARDACVEKYPPVYEQANCAGSNCMAWEWLGTELRLGRCSIISPSQIDVMNHY